MGIQLFFPSDILKPYIKHYWIYRSEGENTHDNMYPSGHVELAINISEGNVITDIDGRNIKMPNMEVLGQLTKPVKLHTTKGTVILITTFHPHATGLFFPHQVSSFTNDSIDLSDVFDKTEDSLYYEIMDLSTIKAKINALDFFFIERLKKNKRSLIKIDLVQSICEHEWRQGKFNVDDLSEYYGYSDRHIQKLFLEFIGVTPKRFFNIQRFNKSLKLIRSTSSSLTSIAYECGYYDQAHFIKEFKEFTGLTPSQCV